MNLLLARTMMITLICCGVMATGAIAIGHRRTGFSVGYQIVGDFCKVRLVDTDRPRESYTRVSKPPFCLQNGAWSPNHHYAVLDSFLGGGLSIGVGRSGNAWRNIYGVHVNAAQNSLVWSPDSLALAYIDTFAKQSTIGIIHMIDDVPKGARIYTLLSVAPIPYAALAWSPDGRFLAFAGYDAARPQSGEELYILRVANGEIQRLTTNVYTDNEPSWSPDGTQLAFTSNESGYPEIYGISIATGERRQITFSSLGYNPNWSADGRWIAFESNLDYSHDLYAIGANGFGLRRLTHTHSDYSLIPVWLP